MMMMDDDDDDNRGPSSRRCETEDEHEVGGCKTTLKRHTRNVPLRRAQSVFGHDSRKNLNTAVVHSHNIAEPRRRT